MFHIKKLFMFFTIISLAQAPLVCGSENLTSFSPKFFIFLFLPSQKETVQVQPSLNVGLKIWENG